MDKILSFPDKQNANIIGTVLVLPREMARLPIGLYEHTMPQPALRLTLFPDLPDVISAELIRRERGSEYELTYCFQNYGDTACRVTVIEDAA